MKYDDIKETVKRLEWIKKHHNDDTCESIGYQWHDTKNQNCSGCPLRNGHLRCPHNSAWLTKDEKVLNTWKEKLIPIEPEECCLMDLI